MERIVLKESEWYEVIRTTRNFFYIKCGPIIVRIKESDIADHYFK